VFFRFGIELVIRRAQFCFWFCCFLSDLFQIRERGFVGKD